MTTHPFSQIAFYRSNDHDRSDVLSSHLDGHRLRLAGRSATVLLGVLKLHSNAICSHTMRCQRSRRHILCQNLNPMKNIRTPPTPTCISSQRTWNISICPNVHLIKIERIHEFMNQLRNVYHIKQVTPKPNCQFISFTKKSTSLDPIQCVKLLLFIKHTK